MHSTRVPFETSCFIDACAQRELAGRVAVNGSLTTISAVIIILQQLAAAICAIIIILQQLAAAICAIIIILQQLAACTRHE